MKRVTFISLAALAAVTVAVFAIAGEEHKHQAAGKDITVIGTLVDTKCYGANNENLGNDHITPNGTMPKCAEACARMGIPVGVLKDGKKGGEVFILVTPSTGLAEHMAKTVKVKGTETFPNAITPDKVWLKNAKGEWEELKIATMM